MMPYFTLFIWLIITNHNKIVKLYNHAFQYKAICYPNLSYEVALHHVGLRLEMRDISVSINTKREIVDIWPFTERVCFYVPK